MVGKDLTQYYFTNIVNCLDVTGMAQLPKGKSFDHDMLKVSSFSSGNRAGIDLFIEANTWL
jgi:hypothetical protein